MRSGYQYQHVAALLDVQSSQDTMPLLVSALYLQSGASYMAQAQALDLISAADSTGRRCLLLGDWNLEQNEGDLAMLIQQGVVRACDAAARGQLLRALTTRLRLRLVHCLTIGPFPMILTSLPSLPCVVLLVGPFSGRTLCLKKLLSFAAAFTPTLKEVTWTKRGPSCLTQPRTCFACPTRLAVPRSSEWRPAAKSARNDREVDTDLSPGLRALRRLLAKFHLCLRRPWDQPLRRATARTIASVRQRVPELPYLDCLSPKAVQVIQALIEARATEEKEAHVNRWKHLTRPDPG